jgi:glycerol-3-phosphate acyltransferase PlsY
VEVAGVLLVAYLLGAIPTSYLVVYALTGRDIRRIGTGNPGTMNVLDHVGFRAALIVAIGDIAKGMAAVTLAYAAGLGDSVAVLAALSAVIGHDYSVFLRLDGGNGTAAAFGGLLALLPQETALAAAVGFGLWPVVRQRRIAGLAAIATFVLLVSLTDARDVRAAGALAIIAFTLLKIIRFEGFLPARGR